MNSNSEAFVHLLITVVIMLLLSLVVYFIGGKFAEMFILNNAQNSGVTIPVIADWKKAYFDLVLYMGITSEAILFIWTALSHWAFRASDSTGLGKRGIWVVLWLILAVLCVAIPLLFVKMGINKFLIIDMSIPLLFFVCYSLFGYWGGSIIATSDRYKYTPLLSGLFRS